MRFLILSQYFPPEQGAAQVRLAAYTRALRRYGHGVEVVTAMPNHLMGRIFEGYRHKMYVLDHIEETPVHRTWLYAATGLGFRRLISYLSFAVTCFIGLAKCQRPDVIFVESPPLFVAISGVLFSKLKRVPMLLYLADLWPDSVRELGVMGDGFLLRIAERLERFIYRNATFILTATSGLGSVLVERKGVSLSKVSTLPNGVDIETVCPVALDAGLAHALDLVDKNVVLYAGTHGAAQNLDTLLEAAQILQDTDNVIVFVGDGHTKARLLERARESGITNVRFVPAQPIADLPKYFALATASIVPLLKRELFKSARPAKVLTSLACGVPIIYCGEGETADFVRKHRVGVVVEPENAKALAQAIRSISRDKAEQSEMRIRCRQVAVENYDWDTIIGRWLGQNPAIASISSNAEPKASRAALEAARDS